MAMGTIGTVREMPDQTRRTKQATAPGGHDRIALPETAFAKIAPPPDQPSTSGNATHVRNATRTGLIDTADPGQRSEQTHDPIRKLRTELAG